MKHRPHCTLCLAGWILGVAGAAEVEAQALPHARLTVEAAPDCASEAAIAARVRARSPQLTFERAGADGGAPQLWAAVTREPDGRVSAALELAIGGRRSQRQIEAASCSEAVDALALLIVLALDPSSVERNESSSRAPAQIGPNAPRTPRTPRTARTGEPVSGNESTTAEAAGGVEQPRAAEAAATDAVAPPAPASESRVVMPPVRDEEPVSEPGVKLSIVASLDARGLIGPAPELLTGVGASVLIGWERESVWSAAIGLAAAHSWLNEVRERGGLAAFQLQVVRLDVCAVRVQLGPAAIRGCGSGSVGRLYARGSDTYDPKKHARLFTMLGGTLLADVALGARIVVRATIGVGAPLRRDAFAFRPDVFHRVEEVVLDLGLGAGVRFP